MGSLLVLADVLTGHEPECVPLTRPAGTLSPTGGEKRGEGDRFMQRGNGIQREPETGAVAVDRGRLMRCQS